MILEEPGLLWRYYPSIPSFLFDGLNQKCPTSKVLLRTSLRTISSLLRFVIFDIFLDWDAAILYELFYAQSKQ